MKKYIAILVLFVLNVIYFAKAVTYVELTPYEKPDCSGDSAGIGYSFIVGECFAIDTTFYKASLSSDHSNSTLTQYHDKDCSEVVKDSERDFEATYCYQAPNYVWNNWVEPNNYVLVSVNQNPRYIPEYGHRQTTYAPADSTCSGNPLFYWYATNMTKIHFDNEAAMFYCINNESFESICSPGCSTYNSMLSCTYFADNSTFGWVQESC